ncbi:hypothetical protein SGLAM104S_07639 [Streptomyces glaucescens]
MADILIAGGGIGGLAAALGLARRGHRVTVLERREMFTEVGAGIQLGPNAFAALTRSASGGGPRPRRLIDEPLHGRTGERVATLPAPAPTASASATPTPRTASTCTWRWRPAAATRTRAARPPPRVGYEQRRPVPSEALAPRRTGRASWSPATLGPAAGRPAGRRRCMGIQATSPAVCGVG